MKRLTKILILPAVIIFYTLLYMASQYPVKCDENCSKQTTLDTTLRNKYSYFYGVWNCARMPQSDTLCITVKDTVGINWDRFADTVCLYANSVGLQQRKIFMVNNLRYPPDTLARKQCP